MSRGSTYPPECKTFNDPQTGACIRQVTDHPAINHSLYFYVTPYPDDGSRLFFVSHRTGNPNLFCADDEGNLLQLTDRQDLSEWSPIPSRDGRYVYYLAGGAAWRLELEGLREEFLLELKPEAGSISGQSASCSLSPDQSYLALAVRVEGGGERRDRIVVLDLKSGCSEPILERDRVMHLQFCPDDPELLQYSGPLDRRIWAVRRDGSQNRYLYPSQPDQWITHESWLPGTREVIFTDWPRALRAVHAETKALRTIARFNCWHPAASPDGRYVVCDTVDPDIGLQLIEVESGRRETLCHPQASNMGQHWRGSFPYGEKPYPVLHSPGHTHPHPAFGPDGKRVVYTSDCTGAPQVYEVLLPH